MSGKTARHLRRQLDGASFPKQMTQVLQPDRFISDPGDPKNFLKNRRIPSQNYQVAVNHNRRIRRIAGQIGGGIPAAVAYYKAKVLPNIPKTVDLR
ncbi:hypothetical protein [Tellurirhabdus bombi]|uniref:hypothetical protein n=1 Tax=Tellurirhabdus bombi TaxID=2907205 RepID=UPI001F364AE4|nr:hypothetical protein [Tellurirhabdus bombi]